jgi:hypothetical protein
MTDPGFDQVSLHAEARAGFMRKCSGEAEKPRIRYLHSEEKDPPGVNLSLAMSVFRRRKTVRTNRAIRRVMGEDYPKIYKCKMQNAK